MTPEELKKHKSLRKQLKKIPEFSAQRRNKLPKPFNKLGGSRIQSTGMVDVSDTHAVFMYWIDGEILTDRSFYGHLFSKLMNGSLYPLFEFHWHPRHKGFHCKIPCNTEYDYTDRTLPGAHELKLKTKQLDPKNIQDRHELIYRFCNACGVLLPDNDPLSKTLWT